MMDGQGIGLEAESNAIEGADRHELALRRLAHSNLPTMVGRHESLVEFAQRRGLNHGDAHRHRVATMPFQIEPTFLIWFEAMQLAYTRAPLTIKAP